MIQRKAFTLVELLVVVAVICLLLAMLAPTFTRVIYLSQVSACGEHLHQFALAMAHYSAEENCYFPRQDLGGTGRNLWDVSNDFYGVLHDRHGLQHQMFFCPSGDPNLRDDHYDYYGYFMLIGYQYWVPRKFGSITAPPDPGDAYHVVVDTEIFRGPISTRDPLLNDNPVLTDLVGVSQGNPLDTDLSKDYNPGLTSNSVHRLGPYIEFSNQAYGDGRVERVHGSRLRPRYLGNWWNWR